MLQQSETDRASAAPADLAHPSEFGASSGDVGIIAIAFADSDEPIATLDGGRVPGGVASTVVDLSGDRPRLAREGALPRAEIERVIGPID